MVVVFSENNLLILTRNILEFLEYSIIRDDKVYKTLEHKNLNLKPKTHKF